VIERLRSTLADRYRIEHELGAGGMASVWLAHDVRHDRKVALKVLRPELAAVVGAERFLAEIRTTAGLQHPNILPLHDSGEVDGAVYYVMPFVDGESLRDRLEREKQLPVADAVRIATEVAGALDYAHRKGIIHRDIKPANILLHDGRAVVADFGIALAASTAAGTRLTETGLSLGTPFYMSPEQAMGERSLDGRSDIYALGCVLYEMLVGEPPFTGPTAQAIMARVMTDEPKPVAAHRRTTPVHVDDAVMTALQKLPADRFGTAAEFASALAGDAGPSMVRTRRTHEARPRHRAMLWPAVAAILAAVALWGWLRPRPEGAGPPPSRLSILLPNLGTFSTALQRQLALTPDGSTLLFTVIGSDGRLHTMRMALDETGPTEIPGVVPFLADYVVSPDGREFIGSVTSEGMYRYSINGGSARPLPREIEPTSFAVWGRDGTIWLSSNLALDRGMARLGADDSVTRPFGTSSALLSIQQILPDGRTALAVRAEANNSGAGVLLDLESGALTNLLDVNTVALYYTAGYLVYVLPDASLEAVAFDAGSTRILGQPVRIASGVSLTGSAIAQLAVAENGTIAWIPEEPRSLVLVDRDGRRRTVTDEQHNFHAPMFSPDGRRIATDFLSADGRDVWTLDVATGLLTRATFDRNGHDATWTPGGESLTYTSVRNGIFTDLRTRPGSAEPPDSLLASAQLQYTGYWLHDGSALVTVATGLAPNSGTDIALVRNGGRGPIEPLVATRFEEQQPAVSRDDRWLAFVSNQSGRNEVYVRPLRDGGEQVQVSLAGGIEPVWSPDGSELFYRSGAGGGSELVTARIQTEPTLTVLSRTRLFAVADVATSIPHGNYDISPDGRTFVMVGLNPSSRITVIQNLPALVRKLSTAGAAR